jgi:PhoD related phosphatase
MSTICGPILGFRGQEGDTWRITVLVVHDGGTAPGALIHGQRGRPPGPAVVPSPLGEVGGVAFFGYEFGIPREDAEHTIEYGFVGEERRWAFAVPGRSQAPRIAYASCNGFSMPGDMRRIADKNALWNDLGVMHASQPFHLLLMGGDQIYADELWDVIPDLRRFNERPRSERVAMVPDPSLPGALERFYVDVYRERFSQPPVAEALASMPSIMMWDDHDIFDGWGSYSDEEQASPVFRTIFSAARTCFALFQLQSDPRAPSWPMLAGQPSFNAFLRLGSLGLLVLDLRSERSQRQVLSLETWSVVFDALDRAEGLRHLLVMSSIPVVHPDLSFVERGVEILPGRQDIEDDLHDQWVSYTHRTERLRLIHRLLDFAHAKGTRVTILSGDVHVAALGVIESVRRPVQWLNANVINQLTSSAIVHPPPARIVRYFLEQMGDEVKEIDRGISAQMLQFPGTNYRFIASRNWLTVEFDESDRIWVNWHVEDQREVLTKVVHPCERVISVS